MKSEAEIKEMLVDLHGCRLAIGKISTGIVAKGSGIHTLNEQRFLHGGGTQAELTAIDLQIALLNHILQ